MFFLGTTHAISQSAYTNVLDTIAINFVYGGVSLGLETLLVRCYIPQHTETDSNIPKRPETLQNGRAHLRELFCRGNRIL